MLADRIGGIISVIIGSVAISEAIRLFSMRTGFFIGDHVFPGAIGALLIFLGLWLVFVKVDDFKVEFPNGKIMKSMMLSLGMLFIYWIIIHFLGYVISTLLVSIGLFKVMGPFSFGKSTVSAVILTGFFYLIFILWLGMPFPTGIFNL